ncbi:MAG: hypothetical protein IKN73_01910 [Alphaproteobacteria bacterium]|nr:hypothetical protein [Alphaproteobacteria bacterium]
MNNKITKHLLHRVKRKFIGPYEITNMVKNDTLPEYIGTLPAEIITRIPENKRKTITIKISKILSEFANNITTKARIDDTKTPYRINFISEYKQIEKQLGKILKIPNVSVQYIDDGAFKFCFLIDFNLTENLYVLQTFKDFHGNKNDNYSFTHGALFEPQIYFTLHKTYSHGRVARPFMSKPVDVNNSTSAYILTKYIDEKHKAKTPIGPFITGRQFMYPKDNNTQNKIQGILIDAGSYEKNPEHIANKIIYLQWQSFAMILDSIDFNSFDACNIDTYLLEEYDKMGDKFFDTTLWPQITDGLPYDLERKTKKILRLLRRLKLKRDSMGPEYEKIRQLLNRDFIRIFDFTHVNKDMHYYEKGHKSQYYPELVCKILDVNNVPPLKQLAYDYIYKSPLIISNGLERVHWNKYYTWEEVQRCIQEIKEGINWDDVTRDFLQPKILQKICNNIREK